ncbi:hypothetical protein ABC974_23055 [Sphingomonas oligophenolica]|uniref:Uncharacterized protein n=1 Tax=Sphingomonas oligophenolica TaxID=301154 RepID=A0ABU9Y9P7_9SPHN
MAMALSPGFSLQPISHAVAGQAIRAGKSWLILAVISNLFFLAVNWRKFRILYNIFNQLVGCWRNWGRFSGVRLMRV